MGEQQPEADHKMQTQNSYTGTWQNEFWRDARDGGFISYELQTFGKTDLTLMVRYWGNEVGSRRFYIKIDGQTLVTENIVGKWNINEFVNVEYPIPNAWVSGKSIITVRFEGLATTDVVGGLFDLRLLQALNGTNIDELNDLQALKISVQDGFIHVEGVRDFELYTMLGQAVSKDRQLAPGIYILRIGSFTKKVGVKY